MKEGGVGECIEVFRTKPYERFWRILECRMKVRVALFLAFFVLNFVCDSLECVSYAKTDPLYVRREKECVLSRPLIWRPRHPPLIINTLKQCVDSGTRCLPMSSCDVVLPQEAYLNWVSDRAFYCCHISV
jgi:hypothetical protein